MWEKLISLQTTSDLNGFWKGVSVLINKPHVLNRRLCGVKELFNISFNYEEKIDNIFSEIIVSLEQDMVADFTNVWKKLPKLLEDNAQKFGSLHNDSKIIIRKCLPKKMDKCFKTLEIVILDHIQNIAYFIPVISSSETTSQLISPISTAAYSLSWKEDLEHHTNLLSLNAVQADPKTDGWLQNHLFPKFKRWSEEDGSQYRISSLMLVVVEKYNIYYQHLKKKYGTELVKIWPEQTDPLKFVYEDVAIAAYLLLLWEQEREEKKLNTKQSFVDLGCGNGLLVYLLTSEGHPGIGIDVRKRKIWDIYGPETKLKEVSITPSNQTLFPEYDWLLGNHSDELTPWIPVIAARSSYNCCFFLLPCCAYNFDSKFQHKKSGVSQYRSYLDFVAEVIQVCGFHTEKDVLRIPSTKRACFIGKGRTYSETEGELIDKSIQEFISKHTKHVNKLDKWSEEFQPRNNVEVIRNCSRVDSDLIKKIVLRIFESLCSQEKNIEVEGDEGMKFWNSGGLLTLSDAASLFEATQLQQLKHECGGLQTLLRNHPYIFEVSCGNVKLRSHKIPPRRSKSKQCRPSPKVKSKLCWFHIHHPNGCFQKADQCLYAHGELDLKTLL